MARYEAYPPPFMTDVMTGGAMTETVEGIAGNIAATARSIAPIDTGAYESSIAVSSEVEVWYGAGPRVIATVSAGTDHADLVESKYGVMMRALGGA